MPTKRWKLYTAGVSVKTQRKYDFTSLSKCDNIAGESIVLYQIEDNYRYIVANERV